MQSAPQKRVSNTLGAKYIRLDLLGVSNSVTNNGAAKGKTPPQLGLKTLGVGPPDLRPASCNATGYATFLANVPLLSVET